MDEPVAKIYPLVPSALDQVRRRAHQTCREDVQRVVRGHAEATPGLTPDVANGAVEGVADALDEMPKIRRRAGR
jgi:hypothetical protein